jgi:hypothetical protein
MFSSGPIFLLDMWWFDRTQNIEKLHFVIDTGVEFLLKVKETIQEWEAPLKELKERSSIVATLLPSIPTTIVRKIDDPYGDNNERGTLYGNNSEVLALLLNGPKHSLIKIKDHDQGKEKGGKSCPYLLLSLGLFGKDIF